MKWVLYTICIVWIATGSSLILYTEQTRQYISRWLKSGQEILFVVITLLVGLLLMFAAPFSRHSWFIVLMGAMAIGKAGFIFFNPNNLYDQMREWYLTKASDQTYRFFGILMLILGTAIFSWVE